MEQNEMHLLKKGQAGLRQLLFGRMTAVLVLLIGQILLLLSFFLWFEEYIVHFFGGSAAIAIIMVLLLQNRQMHSAARNSWTIIIMAMPVFGTLLFLFMELEIGHRLLRRRVESIARKTGALIDQDPRTMEAISWENPGAAALCRFTARADQAVVYQNSQVTYLSLGEDMLEAILRELEKAKKFIYLEYFIVGEGVMWGKILDVLARKAAQGVDVRLMYDGTCEFTLLPKGYPKKLAELGIKCKVFSPATVFISTHYNFRDHRKILVIDGQTGFNGGVNLSDEYINIGSRFGHWKDTAVMVRGEAVRSYTRMFLQMWNLDERTPDFAALSEKAVPRDARGFVMPFGDNPMDRTRVGQTVYMDMIGRARKTVDIMTPYLIIDNEMENALRYAAVRGLRVRLLLPGIPDKYVPYALAKTHYRALVEAGVEIYEYTPGFVHSKIVTVDSREAVVGTINFDYRSFCHHFECGTWMYGCDCVSKIDADFEACFSRCRRVTLETIRNEKWHRKLTGFVLKGFEPLL